MKKIFLSALLFTTLFSCKKEAKETENSKLSAKAEIAQQKLNNTQIFVGFIFSLLILLLSY